MSNYYWIVIKRNLHIILTTVTLVVCAFAIIESHYVRLKSEKALIIAIDNNGTRIVSRQDDPIFETEIIQFAKMFLGLIYNFEANTFIRNVGQASGYMSIKLWEGKANEILALSKSVKDQNIALKGTIQSISALSDNSYLAVVATQESTRMQSLEKKIEVSFELSRVQRSEINPWGIEVTRYEEKILQ